MFAVNVLQYTLTLNRRPYSAFRGDEWPLWFILLTIGVIASFIFIGVAQHKKTKEKASEGIILPRTVDFMEYAEIFTMRKTDFNDIAQRICSVQNHWKWKYYVGNYTVQIESGYRPGYRLSDNAWGAEFCECETPDGREDYSVFRMQFTHFKSSGTANCAEEMNELLTVIEKIILCFDRNAWVQSEPVDFDTKTPFL
ncbi:MAG: hypothetical protein IKQ39_02515 [Oscillospiraceae bacterium]|nr:hypothetical protein [Oscillospiraceae bacterium]